MELLDDWLVKYLLLNRSMQWSGWRNIYVFVYKIQTFFSFVFCSYSPISIQHTVLISISYMIIFFMGFLFFWNTREATQRCLTFVCLFVYVNKRFTRQHLLSVCWIVYWCTVSLNFANGGVRTRVHWGVSFESRQLWKKPCDAETCSLLFYCKMASKLSLDS